MSRRFQVGDRVRVLAELHGCGNSHIGDVGYVVRDDEDCTPFAIYSEVPQIGASEHGHFIGYATQDDLELLTAYPIPVPAPPEHPHPDSAFEKFKAFINDNYNFSGPDVEDDSPEWELIEEIAGAVFGVTIGETHEFNFTPIIKE